MRDWNSNNENIINKKECEIAEWLLYGSVDLLQKHENNIINVLECSVGNGIHIDGPLNNVSSKSRYVSKTCITLKVKKSLLETIPQECLDNLRQDIKNQETIFDQLLEEAVKAENEVNLD